MKGRPDASDAEAANATAPRAGPANRSASGSQTLAAAAMRSPRGASSSGTVSKRYLSRYQRERLPERSTKSPSSSACSTSCFAELLVGHRASAGRASSSSRSPSAVPASSVSDEPSS